MRRWFRIACSVPAAFLLSACPADNHSAVDDESGTGGGACMDVFPIPPEGHPTPAGVFTGIAFTDESHTRVAVGHVDDDFDEPSCCQDYAVAGDPSVDTVRIVFAAGGDGLQAFDDVSDQLVDMNFTRIADVVLADFDGDGLNDVAALTGGTIGVAENTGGATGPYFGTATSYTAKPSNSWAGRSLTALDVDCDGDLDLAAPATNSNHIVILPNSGTSFAAAYRISSNGLSGQRILTSDVNDDGKDDIILSGNDGKVGVFLGTCSGFTAMGPYAMILGSNNTTGMAVAAGKLCPGHPDDIAIAAGYFDLVHVACGDGSGDFDNILEPHGEEPVVGSPTDYQWKMTFGSPSANYIADLQIWSPERELYLLYNVPGIASEIRLLHPSDCGATVGRPAVVAELGSEAAFSALRVHSEGVGSGTEWDRASVVGAPGLGVAR